MEGAYNKANNDSIPSNCDGECGKHYHWWCERPKHQPDQDTWMCTSCAESRDWKPRSDCEETAKCAICLEDKPLTQFAVMLPECACDKCGNRICAECACTLDQKASTYEQVRCPTCKMNKTSLQLRDGNKVDLVHSQDADGGCEGWMGELEGTAHLNASGSSQPASQTAMTDSFDEGYRPDAHPDRAKRAAVRQERPEAAGSGAMDVS